MKRRTTAMRSHDEKREKSLEGRREKKKQGRDEGGKKNENRRDRHDLGFWFVYQLAIFFKKSFLNHLKCTTSIQVN